MAQMADVNYEMPSSEQLRMEQAADEAIRVLSGEEEPLQGARGLAELLRRATREAPLHSLALAFVLGVLVARRR